MAIKFSTETTDKKGISFWREGLPNVRGSINYDRVCFQIAGEPIVKISYEDFAALANALVY